MDGMNRAAAAAAGVALLLCIAACTPGQAVPNPTPQPPDPWVEPGEAGADAMPQATPMPTAASLAAAVDSGQDDPIVNGMVFYGYGGGVMVDVSIVEPNGFELTGVTIYAGNYSDASPPPSLQNPPPESSWIASAAIPQNAEVYERSFFHATPGYLDVDVPKAWIFVVVRVVNSQGRFLKYYSRTWPDKIKPGVEAVNDLTAGVYIPELGT